MADDITQPFGGAPSLSPRYGSSDDALLADLEKAERANMHARDCEVCVALERMSERAKPQVETALRGTIGARKLADLLTRNGYPTGRRAVENHRREDHA